MDPNRGAVAPYESNVGGRRQGSRLLQLIPLCGAPKWHPSKNWEMGLAPGLGGRHTTMIHNNQPNDGVGSGGAWERRRDREERVREDVYPSFRGVECSNEKIKIERDGTLSFDGFRWMGGRNNQPKVSLSVGI